MISAPDGEGLGSKPSALPTEQAGKPVLTVQAAAEALNNSEYRQEGSRELWASMKAAGLVAVFGASDDLMELRGAIDDEVGAYNGTTVFLTPTGLLEECESDCPHSRHAAKQAVGLSAVWCAVGEPAWTYKTAIPHETFNVLEDGEPYCRGIVFDLAKALPQQAAVLGSSLREQARSVPGQTEAASSSSAGEA